VAVLIMLAYILARAFITSRPEKNNLYLNVLAPADDESGNNAFAAINQVLLKYVESANLRRLDRSGTALQATYLIVCADEHALVSLMDDVHARFPGSELSFVEQDNTLGG
jgi:hypothetical protein